MRIAGQGFKVSKFHRLKSNIKSKDNRNGSTNNHNNNGTSAAVIKSATPRGGASA
jgi:hypothetical protein